MLHLSFGSDYAKPSEIAMSKRSINEILDDPPFFCECDRIYRALREAREAIEEMDRLAYRYIDPTDIYSDDDEAVQESLARTAAIIAQEDESQALKEDG